MANGLHFHFICFPFQLIYCHWINGILQNFKWKIIIIITIMNCWYGIVHANGATLKSQSQSINWKWSIVAPELCSSRFIVQWAQWTVQCAFTCHYLFVCVFASVRCPFHRPAYRDVTGQTITWTNVYIVVVAVANVAKPSFCQQKRVNQTKQKKST